MRKGRRAPVRLSLSDGGEAGEIGAPLNGLDQHGSWQPAPEFYPAHPCTSLRSAPTVPVRATYTGNAGVITIIAAGAPLAFRTARGSPAGMKMLSPGASTWRAPSSCSMVIAPPMTT